MIGESDHLVVKIIIDCGIAGKGVENKPHVILSTQTTWSSMDLLTLSMSYRFRRMVSTYGACRMKPTVAGMTRSFALSIQHTTHNWS
jgi:hypothetical protein